VRLLPYAIASGPRNMAVDEAQLHAALEGTASLRLYGWTDATLSLGYFQPHHVRCQHAALLPVPWVRRPSGGLTLVHHRELTYGFALPAGQVGPDLTLWLQRFHEVISHVLSCFGISAALASGDGPANDDCLCFRHVTRGDVVLSEAKVVGSAQRRHRGALLQHGAVLLARSPFTPSLPGIAEQTGQLLNPEDLSTAIAVAVQDMLAWRLYTQPWSDVELLRIADLEIRKYSSQAWNEKR
jgi:lipoate-protein ligase A